MMMTSRCSITRPVRRYLLALQVFFVIIGSSFIPIVLPTALASDLVDFQIWENVTARGNFGAINSENPDLKRWLWWAEIQMRYRDSGQELNQMLVRPGIGYALTEHSTVFLGYAHVTN